MIWFGLVWVRQKERERERKLGLEWAGLGWEGLGIGAACAAAPASGVRGRAVEHGRKRGVHGWMGRWREDGGKMEGRMEGRIEERGCGGRFKVGLGWVGWKG